MQEQERVERSDRGSEVALQRHACAQDVLRGPERFGQLAEHQAVVARVGFGELRKATAAGVVEVAAVDDDAADRRAVPADELGRGVDDDVGAVLERAQQVRRRERVVDDERDPGVVGDRADALEVEHVTLRVPDRLAEERLGVRLDGGPPRVEVVGVVDERDLDAELRERVVQEVVRAAVQRRRRDDVASGLGEVQQRQRLRRLPARSGERADAALQRGDAIFERRLRRVHDAGVDVAELAQPEQICRVVGVAEHVARRLVDRHRPGAGGRVGRGARVDLPGLETLTAHSLLPCRSDGPEAPAETTTSSGSFGSPGCGLSRRRGSRRDGRYLTKSMEMIGICSVSRCSHGVRAGARGRFRGVVLGPAHTPSRR